MFDNILQGNLDSKKRFTRVEIFTTMLQLSKGPLLIYSRVKGAFEGLHFYTGPWRYLHDWTELTGFFY